MRARPACCSGGLGAALEHQVELHTRAELLAYLRAHYDWMGPTDANVTIRKYGSGIDERIGWDTHLVSIDGKAALFSDGPCPDS
jgi:hypothetical protein